MAQIAHIVSKAQQAHRSFILVVSVYCREQLAALQVQMSSLQSQWVSDQKALQQTIEQTVNVTRSSPPPPLLTLAAASSPAIAALVSTATATALSALQQFSA
jgi:hypothetical protein